MNTKETLLKNDPKRWAWCIGSISPWEKPHTPGDYGDGSEWYKPRAPVARSGRDIERSAGRLGLDNPNRLADADNIEIEGENDG